MLAFMLSLPSDWAIYKEWLAEQSAMCGKDKLNRILDELISAGYLVKQQKRSDAGKFAENDWLVYSEKQSADELNTAIGSPDDGKPVNGKSSATKETVLQNKQDTNKTTIKNIRNTEKEVFALPVGLNLEAWDLWKKYRSENKLKSYKPVALGEGAAASKLISLSGGSQLAQMMIVRQSIENQWQGLFALKQDKQISGGKISPIQAAQMAAQASGVTYDRDEPL